MISSCPKCGVRWTNSRQTVTLNGQKAYRFSCSQCKCFADQRIRTPKIPKKHFFVILVDQNMNIVCATGPGSYDQCYNRIGRDQNILDQYLQMKGEMEFTTWINDTELGPLEAKWHIVEFVPL